MGASIAWCTYTIAHVWSSEDNFQKPVHSTMCGTQGSKPGCQAWQQAPFSIEPSCQPEKHIFKP